MKTPARVLAVAACAAALLVISWGVPHYLMNTGVRVVLPPQSAASQASASAVPTASPTPQQQAEAALEVLLAAGAPQELTADFLRFCEEQSPGICTALAAAVKTEGYSKELFWQVSGKSYLYYQALYTQLMAENVHDTGVTDGPAVLAFTGDVNFADDWYNMLHYAKTAGIEDCFGESLLAEMRAADVLLCNNEFVFSDRGSPMPGKQFTFRAKTANVSMWQQLGADIVGLANNHCFDYGEDAFLDTLSTLQGANIPYVGAGKNLEEAMQPQFFLVGGMKIGYVACTRAEKYILTPEAGETSPGVLRCYDPELAVQAIQTASEQCDYLVVYVHWGTEGSTVLEQAQTDLATRFTEAGADLIVGAHPHILQGAGWRKDTPVLYSLGNFWFNMETLDSALLKVTVSEPGAAGATVQLLPCIQTGGRVSLLEEDADRQRVLNSLNDVMENGCFDMNGNLCK
nr:CapA family protein [Fournierella massiliensis]